MRCRSSARPEQEYCRLNIRAHDWRAVNDTRQPVHGVCARLGGRAEGRALHVARRRTAANSPLRCRNQYTNPRVDPAGRRGKLYHVEIERSHRESVCSLCRDCSNDGDGSAWHPTRGTSGARCTCTSRLSCAAHIRPPSGSPIGRTSHCTANDRAPSCAPNGRAASCSATAWPSVGRPAPRCHRTS